MNLFSFNLLVLSLVVTQVAAHTQSPLQNQFKDPILNQDQRINYDLAYFSAQTIEVSPSQPAEMPNVKSVHSTLSAQADDQLTPVLELFDLGDGIGVNGAVSGDFNDDGVMELVLAGPRNVSFVEYRDKTYYPVTQLNFSQGLGKITQYHDGATDNDYLFFLSGSAVIKLNLLTRKIEAVETVPGADSLLLAQFDGDASPELLVHHSSSAVKVFDPVTMKRLAEMTGLTGSMIASGSFTAKGVSEVVLQDGSIYRLANGQIQLHAKVNTDLGYQPLKFDVNKDGLDDLIVSYGWNRIGAIDLANDTLLWSKSTSQDISTLLLADVDQDGKTDVVYGDGQWGSLHAFDMQTTQTFWSINNTNHGVSGIVVADLDNDKNLEIGWGGGYTSSGGDNYYIHDVKTKTSEWTSKSLDFPANAVELADVDNDGDLDALYATASSSNGYNGAQLLAYDLTTKQLLWQITAAPNNWSRIIHIRAADFDKDGKTDIAVAASEVYNGALWLYNGKDGSLKAKQLAGDGDKITGLTSADLNNDGLEEIIISNAAQHTGSQGSVFQVHSPIDAKKLKTSAILGFSWSGIHSLTPFSFTGAQDEIYGLHEGGLYQYSYTRNTVKKVGNEANLNSISAATINGEPALVAISGDNQLVRISESGTTSNIAKLCNDKVSGIRAAGPGRLIYGCFSELAEFSLDTNTEVFSQNVGYAISSTPVPARHQQKDYYIVPGVKVGVFQSGTTQALPTPAPISLKSHVLKKVSGTLQLDGGADYFLLNGAPQFGKFVFDDRKAGTFTYTPVGKAGKDSISFYAVKGASISEAATLTVEVTNQAPVASNLNVSTNWRKGIQFQLPAKDDDGEALNFFLLSKPEHGEVSMTGTPGQVFYMPDGSSLSPVSFSFHAKDTLATSEAKNVVVTLTNTAPKASAISFVSSYETPVNGALKGFDEDGDELTFSITTQPATGSLTLDIKTGLFVYTPAGEIDQQISFSYQVKDKFATSEVQTVSIQIKGKPKPVETKSGGNFAFLLTFMLVLLSFCRRVTVR